MAMWMLIWAESAKMLRAVAYSMLLLSAGGAIASLVFLRVYFNADVESVVGVIKTLLAMMFVLAILTQRLVMVLAPNLRDRLLLKGVFRGCPRWIRIGIWVFWPSVNFVGLGLTIVGHRLGGFFIGIAGLYSISFCITYSFLHVSSVAGGDKSILN
jgi:hypothetical protein